MRKSLWFRLPAFLLLACTLSAASASEGQDEADMLKEQIDRMQQQLLEMQQQLDELRAERDDEAQERERMESRLAEVEDGDADEEKVKEIAASTYDEKKSSEINVGGAVRFQYVLEDYNDLTKDNNGTFEMDTVRLNFDGTVGDVILSAEWRWYQYMNVIHHAWAGYDFSDSLQGQIGVNQVPFGVTPYNSHSFFFSSNYYLGLEDDYDFGAKLVYDEGPLNIQGGFYWSDELGGADSYLGDDGADFNDRYSYDIVGVRDPGEGTYATPSNFAFDSNVANARVAYTLGHGTDYSTELGFSAQYGDVKSGSADGIGSQSAFAAHVVGNYGPWNLQLQATEYEYDMDNGSGRMAVGAYDFYDTIASEATSYTANVAYSLPVNWGPVSNLTFYNDYSLVTDKSADLEDTWMNVTGVAVTSGGLYTYIDLILAENQPFIGGTMDSATKPGTNTRFNINFGYYF
ncbi:carbohydrate porin [Wenzhouxiangella sp. EGI_FJ10409]|uniref:carbohydrate porin n=1 Tax=Wenzhouxiangella sp. EGI_FJ10409 TaxID=3243767 RepID=UPI0035D9FD9F